MSDFLKRLKAEDQGLMSKIVKLKNFINDKDGAYSTLDDINKYLLRKQLYTMMNYLTALMLRINYIEGKDDEIKNLFEGYNLKMIPHNETDTNEVFEIKESARNLINDISIYGKNPRRVAIANTHIEEACMMGVKSLFT